MYANWHRNDLRKLLTTVILLLLSACPIPNDLYNACFNTAAGTSSSLCCSDGLIPTSYNWLTIVCCILLSSDFILSYTQCHIIGISHI